MKVKCKYCEKEFDKYPANIKKTPNHFCCKSHAAIYNNKKYPKRKRALNGPKECLFCSKILGIDKPAEQKYCTHKCFRNHEQQISVEQWIAGKKSGNKGQGKYIVAAPFVRRWLFEKYNSKCVECGWNRVHPITGRIPLQANHIDGNAQNTTPENLELLCPNCHAMTLNYGSLNRGNGRTLGDK